MTTDLSYRHRRYGISRREAPLYLQGRKRPCDSGLLRVPKPVNDAEFAVLSEWWLGVRVTVSIMGGSYSVLQKLETYQDRSFSSPDLQHRGFGQYDIERPLFNHSFGNIYCGGVAGSHYGQFRCGWRSEKRLLRWMNGRRNKQVSSLRKPFVRLAAQIRERRKQVDSR